MKISTNPGLMLVAVLAGLPAVSASGQVYQNQNGQLLDRNTRVGSGGINNGHDLGYASNPSLTNQNLSIDIATRNVSGLNYFHGQDRIFNPNVVQVNDGYQASETLNAQATPAYRSNNGGPAFTSFVGTGVATGVYQSPAAQTQFQTTSNNVGIVPAPVVSPLTPTTDVRIAPNNLANQSNLPLPGDAPNGGPVDPVAVPKASDNPMFEYSPLYGIRPSTGEVFGATDQRLQPGAIKSSGLPNNDSITQMRQELNDSRINDHGVNGQNGNGQGVNGQGGNGQMNGGVNQNGGNGNTPAAGGPSGLTSQQIPNSALNGVATSTGALNNNLSPANTPNSMQTEQGYRTTLVIPAGQQSKQLAQLMQRFGKGPVSDAEATRRYNQERAVMNAADDSKKPAGFGDQDPAAGTPGVIAPGGVQPGVIRPSNVADHGLAGATPAAPKPGVVVTPVPSPSDDKPIVVTSLATGINATGLAKLLTDAEEKMREGKFSKAKDLYDSAEQVAPNNAFVPLGRSLAELGSCYYPRSDADLNHAVALEPAVLGGQYDLKGFLGDDRLKLVTKDLTDISATEKGGRSEVLLAFIAHNTGDDTAAATHLDAAAERGGENDLVDAMRTIWKIPAKAAATPAK